MKLIKKLLTLIIFTTFLVCTFSCRNFMNLLPFENHEKSGIRLTISISDSYTRTAKPESINWSDYDYMLSKDSSGVISNLFETRKSYDNLGNGIILPEGNYNLVLYAYEKNTENLILQGAQNIMLSGTNNQISFVMTPVSGGTGNLEITLTVPSEITNVLGYITDSVTSNSSSKMISIGNFSQPVSGFKTATCTCSELSSAQIQYAVFMMYENSNLVASRIESVMIVKGLTSKAEISLSYDDLKTYAVVISLKKDNEKWEYSDKEIVLINKDDPSVPPVILEDTYGDGTFYGKSVPDGNYDIYIRDAGDSENGTNTTISYNPKNANQPDAPKVNVEFNTITNPSSTVKITPTSPMTGVMSGEDEDEILIIQGYTDPIEFTIETKPGYEADPNGSGISINGTTVILNDGSPNPQTDTNTAPGAQYKITPSVLENLTENSFQGTSLIEYNLTLDPNGGTWDDNSTEVKNFKYTVENLTLPANLTKTSYDFNGWKPSGSSTTFKTIPQGTIGNLQLEATWKDGPKSETKPGSANDKWTEEEISNTDIVGKIFACGYSLIIKWKNDNPDTNITQIYRDNGQIGVFETEQDTLLEERDFSKYKLVAQNPDGSSPADDFTFTILGGNLSGLEGPGKDSSSISTVNIKGKNVIIGNQKDTGVYLTTFTNQRVNINGELEKDFSLTVITGNKYKGGASTNDVVTITDASYAPPLAKVHCLFWETSSAAIEKYNSKNDTNYDINTPRYLPQELEIAKDKSKISLVNSDPISVPDKSDPSNGIIWDPNKTGAIDTEFQLGDAALISIPCSVFSIIVENGKFQIGQTEMFMEDGVTALNTINLGQTGISTYNSQLNTNTDYLYLHMLSETNDITPARATDFLKNILFIKDNNLTDIIVRINLETVPYTEIKNMTEGPNKKGNKFAYYDGSFYLNVDVSAYITTYFNYTKNITYYWDEAYKKAKETYFNGMQGYLMTITSEVENSYIFNQLGAVSAWTGGSRLVPQNNQFDKDEFSTSNTDGGEIFYWQCGPEAGKSYWNGKTSSGTTDGCDYNFENWQHKDNGDQKEPNNSGTETCMQYYKKSEWNDMKISGNSSSSDYIPRNYVVEFRPYSTQYGTQKAASQSVKLDAYY